jgi:hypothetical protein
MRTKLAVVVVAAVLAAACGGDFSDPASSSPAEGLALLSVQPTPGPASLSRSRPAACPSCTSSFSAQVSVTSPSALPEVNLWLDGWSGSRRCLYAQHDSPAGGFTLAGGQPTTVAFSQASVDCEAPFTVDRIDVRMRSGETMVYQGTWRVALAFVE